MRESARSARLTPLGAAMWVSGASSIAAGAFFLPRWAYTLPLLIFACLAGATLLAVLVIGLWLERVTLPLASLCLSALAVAILPVVYPWYFVWLLPGAVLLERPRVRVVVCLLPALAPLLHAVH